MPLVPDAINAVNIAVPLAIPPIDQLLATLFPPPQPASSWLDYRNWVWVEEDHGVVVATTLPTDPLEEKPRSPDWDAGSAPPPASANQGAGSILPPADDYDVAAGGRGQTVRTQRRAEPEAYLFMEGYAMRVNWPIPCPELLAMNGVPLVNCNRLDRGEGFGSVIVANAFYPVYYARWRLRYLASPALFSGGLKVPPNPKLS